MDQPFSGRAASMYDVSMSDWPGEVDFYGKLAAEATAQGEKVLEVACGTGRITIPLAEGGAGVVGFDLSEEMLERAREKSAGVDNVRWVVGNMRSFDLGERFGLAIVPGHSFQFMLTPDEQVDCLECIGKHLVPGGKLVVHLDHQEFDWLGEMCAEGESVTEVVDGLENPETRRPVRAVWAWSFEASTQTATALTVWEEMGEDGETIERWESAPNRLHCVFRYEMEHLLARTGFEAEALYGDFFAGGLEDDSSEMIWVARKG